MNFVSSHLNFKHLLLVSTLFLLLFTRISSAGRGRFPGLFGHIAHRCLDDPIEQRVRKSDFVFTGTIREIHKQDGEVKSALVEIKRIFKGENRLNLLILAEVEGRILPVKYKVCIVEGFSNDNICFKHVHERDTWLFFTKTGGGRLSLNSSVAKLSIVNIARTEAAAEGRQFISPKITYFNLKDKEECFHKPCPFGGQCQKNLISGHHQCKCIFDCEGDDEAVCGSDGETYKNLCQLNKTSCLMKKSIKEDHKGLCKAKDPCSNVTCQFGSKCVSRGPSFACLCTKDESCEDDEHNSIEGNFKMRDKLLCATDGREYQNECELRYKMCLSQKEVKISHHGSCDPCQNMQCYFGATCVIHDPQSASCACQQNCSQVVQKQCGSDGLTYDNLCFMNKASCLKQQEITLLHNGPCVVSCEEEECKYGSACIEGACVCPSNCSTQEEPVCGTDGLTHINECALFMLACNQRLPITVAYLGECEEEIAMEDKCETKTCLYGGKCEVSFVDGKRIEECLCSFFCEDERMSVCGSDGRIYLNECYLTRSACRKQLFIRPEPMQHCQDSTEEFCDGFPVMHNQSAGDELKCGDENHDDCPPAGYCHIIGNEGRCCQGYQVVSGCELSQYGCCPDMMTAAMGPDYFGCDMDDEFACQCNTLGSIELLCDQSTRKCNCKPKVAGMRCDRCESNYWGFLRIADGEEGCQACNCNEYGSQRDDCDQTTGQCMCLENVVGVKCDLCSNGSPVAEHGCPSNEVTPTFISSSNSNNGKTKKLKTSRPPKILKSTKMPKAKYTKVTTERLTQSKMTGQYLYKTEVTNFSTPRMSHTNYAGDVSINEEGSITEPEMVASTEESTYPLDFSSSTLSSNTEDTSSTDYMTPYFAGDSYVELKPLSHGSRDTSIEIGFRSLTLNGLIFFAGHLDAKKGDFISIAIINGSLEFKYDLGSGSTTLRIPSGVKLNHLHRVNAVRHDRDGLLKLDEELKDAGLSPGKVKSLDTGVPMYLGSIPDKSIIQYRTSHVAQGFRGCIDFLKIVSSELNHEYDLSKTSSSDILSDRKTSDCRESCTDYECIKGIACQSEKETVFACKCPERNYGLHCEFEDQFVETPSNRTDLKRRIL